MAGLVPAIHAFHYCLMAGGYVYFLTNKPNGILYIGVTKHWSRAWKVRKIASDNPNWDDLYQSLL